LKPEVGGCPALLLVIIVSPVCVTDANVKLAGAVPVVESNGCTATLVPLGVEFNRAYQDSEPTTPFHVDAVEENRLRE